MASDPNKPMLRLRPSAPAQRQPGRQANIQKPDPFPKQRQEQEITPKFTRLAQVLQRDPSGLSLRTDPTALAPERLLVFEVKGDVANFARAVNRVPGLELIDEEELPSDEDKAPLGVSARARPYRAPSDLITVGNLDFGWRAR
ncbi:hypothetical protein ACQZ4Q_23355 [Agrobacterium vitis]